MSPSANRKPQPPETTLDHTQSAELAEIIWALVVERGNPAQVLELLYWSEEPGFFELIRSLATLPTETREALQSFIDAAPRSQMIAAIAEKRDRLVLSHSAQKASPRKSPRVATNV
jgi:hypothetical protein